MDGIEVLHRSPVNADPLRDVQLEPEYPEDDPPRYDSDTVDAMFGAFDAILRIYLSAEFAGTIHNSVATRLCL